MSTIIEKTIIFVKGYVTSVHNYYTCNEVGRDSRIGNGVEGEGEERSMRNDDIGSLCALQVQTLKEEAQNLGG